MIKLHNAYYKIRSIHGFSCNLITKELLTKPINFKNPDLNKKLNFIKREIHFELLDIYFVNIYSYRNYVGSLTVPCFFGLEAEEYITNLLIDCLSDEHEIFIDLAECIESRLLQMIVYDKYLDEIKEWYKLRYELEENKTKPLN